MSRPDPAYASAAVPSARFKPRRRLFRKYVLFFVGVVLLALLSTTYLEYRYLVRDYTGFSVRLQRERAQAAADQIDHFVKDIESQIAWTTQLPWNAATIDEWRLDAARLLRQVPAITEYAKVDASGKELLAVSRLAPDRLGSRADFSRDPRFTVANTNGIYRSSVDFRRNSEPYMSIAIRGPGNDIGIAEVNLKFIWDLVSQIRVGESGRAYAVDDKGRVIAHPNLNVVLRNTDASLLQQVRTGRRASNVVPPEQEGAVKDLDGREVLAASAPIPTLDWLLLVELPVNEAFASLDAAIQRTGLLLAASLIIAIVAGLFLARTMVVPIELLRAGAMRIGAGNLEERIAINTGDEVEALAEQFNIMAAQLQESHATLKQRVDQRTAELTAANRRLTTAGERLRRLNSVKTEILAIVAHDLKNPLSVITTRTELLAKAVSLSPPPQAQIAAHIKSIEDSSGHLIEMIDSLLADAMAEAHEISIRRTAVNIPALMNEVVQANLPLAERKEQSLTITLLADLTLFGDYDRLREAIDNLVSNAVKYTQREGKIRLELSVETNSAVITVTDNGQGLTDEDMSRLFGRFQRLSAQPTGGEASTGLGLSIVRRIVELHGGKVTAQSGGAGKGSTFTVSLPLASVDVAANQDLTSEAPGGEAELSTSQAAGVNTDTILLIDDNRDVREGLQMYLQAEGLNTMATANADDALAAVEADGLRPSLIVADYNLGGRMNGVESVAALRAALGWRVPAILLTGDSTSLDLQTIARRQINSLTKPWKGEELLELVRRLRATASVKDQP